MRRRRKPAYDAYDRANAPEPSHEAYASDPAGYDPSEINFSLTPKRYPDAPIFRAARLHGEMQSAAVESLHASRAALRSVSRSC